MGELPDSVHDEITRLSELGNDLAAEGRHEEALERFREAMTLVPEPKTEWGATMWLLVAIGDMQFLLGRFEECRAICMKAVVHFDEAKGNPFIRLRLGQSMFELGEDREAANWLAGAFLEEGVALFEDDDPKYLAFVKAQLKPPIGGWPDGW